jgi:hypothetical protein
MREAKIGALLRHGLAAKMLEFLTWKGVREIPTPSGLPINRQAENMKFNSGQNPSASKPNR